MKLSEKKDLYRRFMNKELNAKELDQFFILIESGAFDDDFMETMPAVEAQKTLVTPRRHVYPLIARLTAAASLLLVLGVSYLVYQNKQHDTHLKQQSVFITVSVPVGRMKIITLADHSIITLISGSIFKYPAAFADHQRSVFLVKGKGFFEIAKDKTKPFTVYSAKLSTTALGTSFTVENYKDYQMEKIQLFTGKVRIGSKMKDFKSLHLIPGQQYSRNHHVGIKEVFDMAVHTHTEDGTLKFENTSLKEALIRVASYYNTRLVFDPAILKNFAINGQFKNEPLEDVLHNLLFTHHLKFKKTQEGYLIMK